jgi:inner membrane protein involved in colicin E2 resistance
MPFSANWTAFFLRYGIRRTTILINRHASAASFGAVMLATRKVDWYGIGKIEQAETASTTTA